MSYKKDNNKEIYKALEILSKPNGIQAYTLNGEKTDLTYNDLINSYVVDTITCKNGTIATLTKLIIQLIYLTSTCLIIVLWILKKNLQFIHKY